MNSAVRAADQVCCEATVPECRSSHTTGWVLAASAHRTNNPMCWWELVCTHSASPGSRSFLSIRVATSMMFPVQRTTFRPQAMDT